MKIPITIKVGDLEEISQTPIQNAFLTYRFIHADYGEGLNYSVNKELINRTLAAVEEVTGDSIEKVENDLSAKEYLEMVFPLLRKCESCLKGGE